MNHVRLPSLLPFFSPSLSSLLFTLSTSFSIFVYWIHLSFFIFAPLYPLYFILYHLLSSPHTLLDCCLSLLSYLERSFHFFYVITHYPIHTTISLTLYGECARCESETSVCLKLQMSTPLCLLRAQLLHSYYSSPTLLHVCSLTEMGVLSVLTLPTISHILIHNPIPPLLYLQSLKALLLLLLLSSYSLPPLNILIRTRLTSL